MTETRLTEGNRLLGRIQATKDVLEKIDKLSDSKKNACITNYDQSVRIPDELRDAVFKLLKSHFKDELSELESIFEAL